MSPRAEKLALALGFALLALLGAYAFTHLRVGNEITHFLPAGGDARLAYASRAVAESELSRAMILAVEGPDTPRAVAGARALADSLRTHPEVAWLRSGVDPELERAVYDAYFPRRHAFLSEHPERELAARLTDEGLIEQARAVRTQLAGPMGSLTARTAGDDPLAGFASTLERLRSAQAGALTVYEGQFVSADGRHAVLFLASKHSAFDAAHQRPLLEAIDAAFSQANRAQGGALRLRQSGAHRIAVAAEAGIRADVHRITVFSTVGIVVLFLLVHRSLRYLLVASLPLGAGMLTAMAVSLFTFGKLHGLTLAFGASLIGVCFDYPVFLINHYTLRPAEGGARPTLARVWPGILLGALTTIGGLAGLALTSFPGLREIAVFGACGVIGALLATYFLVPALLPRTPIPVRFQRALADGVTRASRALQSRRRYAAIVPAAALAVCALGLPRLRWTDDARALTSVDPAYLREESSVRALVSRLDEGRFVITLGDTDEQALQRSDRAAEVLAGARADGLLANYRSPHALLWSRDLQRRNEEALRASPNLASRANAAFEREGFRAGALDGFARAVASPAPEPLTYDALLRTPLAPLVRPFRIPVGGRFAYLTFVEGVRDPAALAARVDALEDTAYFDQSSFLRETYGYYRRRTLAVIVAGLGGVFVMLFARYRSVPKALAAFVPSVLSGAVALAVVGLLKAPANLMHLLGLLLVLSIGVDYGVFVAETSKHARAASETLLSVVIAWVSALLSFGLLAVSSNPALHAIGLTTGVGLTGCLLLVPATQSLLARASENHE